MAGGRTGPKRIIFFSPVSFDLRSHLTLLIKPRRNQFNKRTLLFLTRLTSASGAVHLEISPAQPTPGSMTTTISGEGTTSVVAARGKVNGDDHSSELRAAWASAADAPHVSNVTTDKDRLHAYTLVLKTGPAPAVPPVPTIGGGSYLVPTKHTGVCPRGRAPSNYRASNHVSVLNAGSARGRELRRFLKHTAIHGRLDRPTPLT